MLFAIHNVIDPLILDCIPPGHGLVFIDESYLAELNDADLLYAMDILLDSSGTSELICAYSSGVRPAY